MPRQKASKGLTAEAVVNLLNQRVPSSHVVDIPDTNIFGVNEDSLDQTRKHISLLLAIATVEPYPKLTVLTDGVELWKQGLGQKYKNLSIWWARQQAYSLQQMLSRARKTGHNASDSMSRIDGTIKPLVELLKSKAGKEDSDGLHKSAVGSLGKGGKRRLHRMASSPRTRSASSMNTVTSPRSTQPNPGLVASSASGPASFSPGTLRRMFGVPSDHDDKEAGEGDGQAETQSYAACLSPGTLKRMFGAPPDPDLADEEAVPESPADVVEVFSSQEVGMAVAVPCPEEGGPTFWNSKEQVQQAVLPSGQVVNLGPKYESVFKKPAAKIGSRPPAKAKAKVSSKKKAQNVKEKAWNNSLVDEFTLVQAKKRHSAYIMAKMQEHGSKLIVEVKETQTAKYTEVIDQIIKNLRGRRAKGVKVFKELKKLALDLRKDLI